MMNRVKEYRAALKITQENLAKDSDCSIRSIKNYESGEQAPNVNIAKKIAKALNRTVEEVFPDHEERERSGIGSAGNTQEGSHADHASPQL